LSPDSRRHFWKFWQVPPLIYKNLKF